MNNSPLSSCKNLPPYFFMVHLLHRLYGVDAPGPPVLCLEQLATGDSIVLDPWRCSRICRRRVCCATLCLRTRNFKQYAKIKYNLSV